MNIQHYHNAKSNNNNNENDNDGKYSNYKSDKYKLSTKITSNNNTNEKIEEIIEKAVEEIEYIQGKSLVNSPTIKKILDILENFIKSKKLIIYGGTAVNNILPKKFQFYDKTIELPDYDMYSTNALEDAKELADIYFKNGFEFVEAKSGFHFGTYKVFVNFFGIADITNIDQQIFNNISKEAIIIQGIRYCPVNFLKMGMYYELSKPKGDVSRWEKVYTRLNILNSVYPPKYIDKKCINYTRKEIIEKNKYKHISNSIFHILSNYDVVFIGLKAIMMISKQSTKNIEFLSNASSYDILCYNPMKILKDVKVELEKKFGLKNIKIEKKHNIGEILPNHYFLLIDNTILIFAYQENACYSYNTVKINKKTYKIGTIDTVLYFYYAFLYVNKPYYDKKRLLCLANLLFEIQKEDILKQTGLLKRFVPTCYGNEKTLEDAKKEKYEKKQELLKNEDKEELRKMFFKYDPKNEKNVNSSIKTYAETENKPKPKTKKDIIIKSNTEHQTIKKKNKRNQAKKSYNKTSKNKLLLDKILGI